MKPSSFFTILKSGLLLLAVLLAGCSGTGTGPSSSATGAATAKLVWQQAADGKATKAAAPAGVTTVRVIISAAGMTTIQQDYAAGLGTGTISNIPVGANRTFTFQGLNAGSTVTHQAVVNNVTITAGATTDLGNITMLVVVAPAAPSGLGASSVSTTGSTLSWTDSDQLETGFVIERKTGAGGVWAQIATPAANSVTYSDSGLTAGTVYYYRIKAINGAGDSAWSNEANAQTATIDLAKTGQTTKYADGDDGDLEKGVAWPAPRFTDNSDGTVTDNLTGLIWLKFADCWGLTVWQTALTNANSLASGACGLTDGSVAGDWRLPNRKELLSLVDRSRYAPAVPVGHPFIGNLGNGHWSSSSVAGSTTNAWGIWMYDGSANSGGKSGTACVWPVRGGL